jgi:alpha-N-arabinofuranosidase
LDVFRDFMAVPEILQQKWAALRDSMAQAGVPSPRLAVTELQLFAHLGAASDKSAPVRLTPANLPNQASITEALYDILIYHAAIRLLPFVDLITHSAVVNHGGGLRKERERVWANPCQEAQAAFAEFGGAKPVPIEIESAQDSAPLVLPDLKSVTKGASFNAIDALAALSEKGDLLVSLVHRGTNGPIHITLQVDQFNAAPSAQLHTLTAQTPWDGNSLEHPELVKPTETKLNVRDAKVELDLPPYTVARLHLAQAEDRPPKSQ